MFYHKGRVAFQLFFCDERHVMFLQDTRQTLFKDFIDCGKDFAKVEARFEQRLNETQRSSVKYGFRSEEWLRKKHGDKKAQRIMDRKKSLGLTLVLHFPSPLFPTGSISPPSCLTMHSHLASIQLPRPATAEDGARPGAPRRR